MPNLSRATRILLALREQGHVTAGIHKNLLYSIVSSDVLQGILVEGTPYKDTVYVWRVCMPMYRPANHVTLNFSQRFCQANHQSKFIGNVAEIANAIHSVVEASTDSYDRIFGQTMSAETFSKLHVDRINWELRHMPARLFEAGATFAVTGSFGRAEPCLKRCLDAFAPSAKDAFPMWQAAKDYLDAMAIGADAVMRVARHLEDATRLTLGLEQMEPAPTAG